MEMGWMILTTHVHIIRLYLQHHLLITWLLICILVLILKTLHSGGSKELGGKSISWQLLKVLQCLLVSVLFFLDLCILFHIRFQFLYPYNNSWQVFITDRYQIYENQSLQCIYKVLKNQIIVSCKETNHNLSQIWWSNIVYLWTLRNFDIQWEISKDTTTFYKWKQMLVMVFLY